MYATDGKLEAIGNDAEPEYGVRSRVVALASSRDGVISFVVTLLATGLAWRFDLHSCGLSAEGVIGRNHGALYESVASPERRRVGRVDGSSSCDVGTIKSKRECWAK